MVSSRHRSRSSINTIARAGWRWATVEAIAELIGPDDPSPNVDSHGLRRLLEDIFKAGGGTHDDWDRYYKAMVEERRTAVLLNPRRTYSNPQTS